jgi:CheY-like chemotaxis protein
MTAILVVLMFAAFVGLDALVRSSLRRAEQRRVREAREAALHQSIRLDFTDEAKSLRRVEVPEARARVLAVDDEAIVLDSLRKILVLEGFSVDTVESGPEALGLVQRHDYDFVFTDLKMPGMDGVEVVKAVKHLRPDIDVVVVTGYATIESAIETMKHGAIEYVQKPFTVDELSEFARKILIRREARLEAQRRPLVRIVAPAAAATAGANEFCVPGGAFVSSGHAWARIESSGQVRIGLDDFARKALGPIDRLEPPARGGRAVRGEPLFSVVRGPHRARFLSPVSGEVTIVNEEAVRDPSRVAASPYDLGWVCILQPSDLAGDLAALRIGRPVVDWYQDEIDRLRKARTQAQESGGELEWNGLEQAFLDPAALSRS